jgi:hypothetical protein
VVLEKDIHSCNFERLSLTKAIEVQKKVLNEIIDEMELEKRKQAISYKRKLKPISSTFQNSV